ncbi:MAG: deoxyribonuclease IV [Candidatus Acidulodesulfobacterium ferriphilum]|jgi:deoxyribonuclease-4|uniref:Probable endonuclease 4 n=1 Tax=Candidatus Acidulodesulfobacterium ferriphilum TaxID=2597223 RepID=A0A519BDJ6_9DELT|nr:MAG: deoxyribonuclease IV [Candidatus Acidulodesulfobacterium ferriphilum]
MKILLGAHVSIAGGLKNVCAHAKITGSNAVQIFTKNQLQWSAKELDSNEISSFKKCAVGESLTVAAHLSYLVNLGSTDETIKEKSTFGIINEIKRCSLLGIKYLVFHPGSNKYLSEEETIKQIALNLSGIIKQTAEFKDVILVLETTAGQGNQIGYRLEHIAGIIGLAGNSERLGVCIDTCHIFAAGCDIRTLSEYNKFMKDFEDIIGFNKLKVVHLNDSLKPLGSKVDRHASIGKGCIGQDAFGFIVNDKRLEDIPLIIETPGSDREHKIDLDVLKGMIKK